MFQPNQNQMPPQMQGQAPTAPSLTPPSGLNRNSPPEQIANAARLVLTPQEMQMVQQAITPQVVAALVKVFGPAAQKLLGPLVGGMNADPNDPNEAAEGNMAMPGRQMAPSPFRRY